MVQLYKQPQTAQPYSIQGGKDKGSKYSYSLRREYKIEDNEKKLRSKNVIVYRLSEDVLPSDCSKEFLNIVGESSLKPKIIEMCRLGKLREDNKPRPIRVKLESRNMRYKILSHAYRLKNHPRFKNIYLKPDLTKNERILQKELWLDMKRKISEEPRFQRRAKQKMGDKMK